MTDDATPRKSEPFCPVHPDLWRDPVCREQCGIKLRTAVYLEIQHRAPKGGPRAGYAEASFRSLAAAIKRLKRSGARAPSYIRDIQAAVRENIRRGIMTRESERKGRTIVYRITAPWIKGQPYGETPHGQPYGETPYTHKEPRGRTKPQKGPRPLSNVLSESRKRRLR